MKKSIFPFTIAKGQKLTKEQSIALFGKNYLEVVKQSFIVKDSGAPWYITRTLKGICCSMNFETKEVTVYGIRTMTNCRQSGYDMEGYVSIKGKKYSCFTSSDIFETEKGHLIDAATIFPRIK